MRTSAASRERQKILEYMNTRDFARAKELRELGISSRAMSLATEEGLISRQGRGIYMAKNIEPEYYLHFAENAKRYPNYPICLMSALSYYNVTVEIPRKTWIAIKAKSWDPKQTNSRIRTVRFREPYFSQGLEIHKINGVEVQIYSLEKSIADAFRNPRLVDRAVAIEALKTTLSKQMSSVARIYESAMRFKAVKQMLPILEVITSNG